MMGTLDPIATESGIPVTELTIWIDRGWVLPEGTARDPVFTETDRARIGMIAAFQRDLGIDDDVMPVVLDLLDRLHAARARLSSLIDAVSVLPAADRARVLRQLQGHQPP